ncbi:hypothetical protein K502DRAFT_314280 [Neoconidiobolus thromboides FSU 785]|nr:hypothetical protein K502DRAFT_314280 [Neoconidiobolus thromboides FSU 785]
MLNSPLFNAQNLFYFGAYQAVANECTTLQSQINSQYQTDLKVLLYRAYLALGKYNLVSTELNKNDLSSEFKVIKLLSKITDPKNNVDDTLINEMEAIVNEGTNLLNPTLQLLFALACIHANKLEPALKAVSLHPKHLECVSYKVQILLALDRVDLAEKELNKAKSWAEDVPLIQLIEAWIDLRLNGNKLEEAYAIFDEISQQSFANTVKLMNSKAVAYLQVGQYQEAEEILLEAMNKDNNDPNTLANLAVCSDLTEKPSEVKQRYINQLRDIDPNHPLIVNLDAKATQFDVASQKYAIEN